MMSKSNIAIYGIEHFFQEILFLQGMNSGVIKQ